MDIEKERQRIEGDPSLAEHEKKAALDSLLGKKKPKKSLFTRKEK